MLAKLIDDWQEKTGCNGKQLADLIGCSPQTISNYRIKQAIPKRDILDKICEVIGADVIEVKRAILADKPGCDGYSRTVPAKTRLGSIIDEWKLSSGKNGYDLAELVGCHVSTISKYRSGKAKPSQEIVERFSEVFGVSVGELWKAVDGERG